MTWSVEPIERWKKYVAFAGPDECWEWTGHRLKSGGYGQLAAKGGRGNPLRAHRFAYEYFIGPIPSGMFVLHRCDNPPCVNPAHLFLGTQADNMRDMGNKGRGSRIRRGFTKVNAAKTHCPAGHPYAGDNLYVSPSTGHRRCRACATAREAERPPRTSYRRKH